MLSKLDPDAYTAITRLIMTAYQKQELQTELAELKTHETDGYRHQAGAVLASARVLAENSDWKKEDGETLEAWVTRTLKAGKRVKEEAKPHLEQLSRLLSHLTIGACTCMTKTPELVHHAPECKYRLAAQAQQIVLLLSNLHG